MPKACAMLDLIQGSAEWLAARAGKLGASQVADALAKTKTGEAASRKTLRAQLVTERLTGRAIETFCSPAMQRGKDLEPLARESYSEQRLCIVTETGIVRHPVINNAQCSPDGLVGEEGLLEIKCCGAARHVEILTGSPVEDRYVKQCLWQLACTGRQWVDLAYFNPDFPDEMQLHVQRIERDEAVISELEKQVVEFLGEVDATLAELREKYMREAA